MNLYKEFIIYFWIYTLMDFYTLTYLYTYGFMDLWFEGNLKRNCGWIYLRKYFTVLMSVIATDG